MSSCEYISIYVKLSIHRHVHQAVNTSASMSTCEYIGIYVKP